MKKVLVFALCSLFLVPLKAVNYCASSAWGYGASATGGGTATPTLVTSESELRNALKSSNKVIIITNDITISGDQISCSKDNLTIMALPGKKLISNNQTTAKSGIIAFSGTNIILRNITFIGPGAYDIDGHDNLTLSNAKNVWVDHCDFQDGMDGNFDINEKSDNITVTWCRFRYLKDPKAGGTGGSDDHRYSNLVGGGSNDKPADGTYNITYGFCWWDEGCKERMTRCRNCELHFLNCYWNSSVANYYVGPENAKCYFEGCTFSGKANTSSKIFKSYGGTNYCTFVNCTGNIPSDIGTVSAPSYNYDHLSAADAKNYVTDSNCGTGATLTVTSDGAVSSSCDSDTPVDPQPPVTSEWWNISDDDFKNLGTITSETTVRNLHIVATEQNSVIIDGSAKTVGDISFTHRLKLGGTGNTAYRHLWFDVTGSCSITVYLTSSSGSGDARTLNIASGSFNNVVSTMSAPVGSVNTQTYSYTGNATTIYLYSAASGVNIYGIKLAYPSPTGLEHIEKQSAAHKVLRNGQVVILREGRTYSILGARID